MHRIAKLTEFGKELSEFMFRNSVPMTVVARDCDVKYETLRATMVGRTAGHEVIPKVRAYMESYSADQTA